MQSNQNLVNRESSAKPTEEHFGATSSTKSITYTIRVRHSIGYLSFIQRIEKPAAIVQKYSKDEI
jgi:hypothetical protein